MLQHLKAGDEVAILPNADSLPSESLEIATIGMVGTGYIQLADGRMYSSTDGRCMGSWHGGNLVVVTAAHRAAVRG
jgi:hypothetical protein